MSSPLVQPVSPLSLAVGALRVLWGQRDDALRLGMVPALLLFGGFVYGWESIARYWDLLDQGQPEAMDTGLLSKILVLFLISGVAAALVVSNWLRFLLLGPMSAIGLGLRLDRNHFGFFASAAALFVALGLALAILSMPLGFLPAPFNVFSTVALMIGLLVVFARLVFVPVSIAIGQPLPPGRAWIATRGNGFRLAFALAIVELPIFLVLNFLVLFLGAVGFAAAAPLAMMFIAAIFQIAILIAQAGVLAAAFRHLVGIEV